MSSPILSIHPSIPAFEQQDKLICSMATSCECDKKLVAEARTKSRDGSVHHWRVCGEWLTTHPSAIDHIETNGFQEPATP